MQLRYWKWMTVCHFHWLLINEHLRRSIKAQRAMNIFVALASSSSIAGWAVWKELWILWMLILAAFQVLTLIRQYLPADQRVERLASLSAVWKAQYRVIEQCWYPISKGKFTEDEINDRMYEYMKTWEQGEEEHLNKDSLTFSQAMIDRVTAMNNTYFETLK